MPLTGRPTPDGPGCKTGSDPHQALDAHAGKKEFRFLQFFVALVSKCVFSIVERYYRCGIIHNLLTNVRRKSKGKNLKKIYGRYPLCNRELKRTIFVTFQPISYYYDHY